MSALAMPPESLSGCKVVGQFFDNKIGPVASHLLGEQNFTPKMLICIE